ncbi:ABC transporter substrate-binding protein [Bradyrhizobium sp. USDA 10063]
MLKLTRRSTSIACLLIVGMLSMIAPADAQQTKLKLGVTATGPAVGIMSPFAALMSGQYESEGLDVSFVNIASGPETIQRMIAGEIEGGVSVGTLPFFQAVAANLDLVWIASTLQNTSPIMVKGSSTEPAQLNGKRFGSPGVGTIQDTLFQLFERNNSIKTTHVYGRMNDLLGYLEKGEIDGVVGWQPTMEIARKKLGATYVTKSILPGAQITGMVFPRRFLEGNREVILRFLRANLRGIEAFRKDKNAFVEWAAKREGVDVDVLRALYLEPDQFWVENPRTDMASVKVLIKAAKDSGKISSTLVLDDAAIDAWTAKLIDERLLEQAIKETKFQVAEKP